MDDACLVGEILGIEERTLDSVVELIRLKVAGVNMPRSQQAATATEEGIAVNPDFRPDNATSKHMVCHLWGHRSCQFQEPV